MVVTGVGCSAERRISLVSTPEPLSAAAIRSPAASSPREQKIPVFKPSFAAATASLTASPPAFREPEAAR